MVDFGDRLKRFQSAKLHTLRRGQQLVLEGYADCHLDTRDLAIEMPTGEGKTLVALLIADYALDQRFAVAYLTGTRQLADHVAAEAATLGLDAMQFAGGSYGGSALKNYHDAQAVGIMNYWVYFNTRPVPQPADLVIFDDAHLAEQPLTGLHMLRIPRVRGDTGDLYESLCDLILARTNAYGNLRAMRDGTAPPDTPPELLAFNDWSAVARLSEALIDNSSFSSHGPARFAWREVRSQLSRCGVLISPSCVEIRPYHPPTTLNKWYTKARQRIYLSATLGSMDDLQRRTGGYPITRLIPASPLPRSTTGERRFILNPTQLPALDSEVLGWALKQAASAGGRTTWLCSSHAEADKIENLLEAVCVDVFKLRAGDDMLDEWKQSPRGHLVTAGRYDGLDLAGDLCRLVVIPTVPYASSEFERFVVAYLGDASFMRHRIGQRITQAIGRANRARDDQALYLGLDPAFSSVLADPQVSGSVPPAARSVISEALELHQQGPEETRRACEAFWRKQPHRVEENTQTIKARPGRLAQRATADSAHHEVVASTELWIGGFSQSAAAARAAAAELASVGETEHAAFWRYVEAHAHYQRGKAFFANARAALEEATHNGPPTVWFRRLQRSVEALSGQETMALGMDNLFFYWDEWIRERGTRVTQDLTLMRTYLTGTHDQRCEALKALARLAGARGERPSRSKQGAPDCRWSWSTPRQGEWRVWEVKTGNAKKIPRSEVNQVLGQIEAERHRSGKARLFGCLMSSAREGYDEALEAARDRIVLLHSKAVERLFAILQDRFLRYFDLYGEGTAEERGEARTVVEPLLPQDGWLEKLLVPSQGRVLLASDVEAVFPTT
ncbi:MAG: hypothetical protein KTV45_10070 [Acidimicrobiia bacterium]|nr:hypothetical protein [Acidimicrobiia bacterium]